MTEEEKEVFLILKGWAQWYTKSWDDKVLWKYTEDPYPAGILYYTDEAIARELRPF